MSLLSANTLNIIKATRGVVAENALAITQAFYPRMLKGNPEVLTYFNEANQKTGAQPRALADAVVKYAVNIEELGNLSEDVTRIVQKHCALNVQAADYQVVHDHLMAAIGEVLGDAVTPEIGNAWSEAVMSLAGILINAEAEQYKATAEMPGGWAGKRKFRVVAKDVEADDVATLSYAPVDGQPIVSHSVGQYITVNVNPEGKTYMAPRHYTLTNEPGASTYQTTVKGLGDGVVSKHLVNEINVGDELDLFPPFGGPTLLGEASRPAVFISAGIGITPWANMLPEAASTRPRVVLFHADSSESAQPKGITKRLEEAINAASGVSDYSYKSKGDLLDVAKIEERLVAESIALADADFFLSLRPDATLAFAKELQSKGATAIHANEFGPHTKLD